MITALKTLFTSSEKIRPGITFRATSPPIGTLNFDFKFGIGIEQGTEKLYFYVYGKNDESLMCGNTAYDTQLVKCIKYTRSGENVLIYLEDTSTIYISFFDDINCVVTKNIKYPYAKEVTVYSVPDSSLTFKLEGNSEYDKLERVFNR